MQDGQSGDLNRDLAGFDDMRLVYDARPLLKDVSRNTVVLLYTGAKRF